MARASTGKTETSVFFIRELKYKRVLFLVHRNQIAKPAKPSSERVFGSETKNGFVSRILQESRKFGGYILNAQRRGKHNYILKYKSLIKHLRYND